MQVAALFVVDGGCYFNVDGVDPWPESRDARAYKGDEPCVLHPPCQRWGRYWSGGPSAKVRRIKGDDDGCFASAMATVERVGGVIEHPEASHAWAHFGLDKPPRKGGWIKTRKGWTCCVEQGHYGHKARKATWLYYVGNETPPELIWGKCEGKQRLDEGFSSTEARRAARAAGIKPRKTLTTKENLATPVAFRDLLIGLARMAIGYQSSVKEETHTVEV